MPDLVLLSNSRTENGWLVDHVPAIREVAGGRRKAFFVPYAVVGTPWEEITSKLFEVLSFLSPESDLDRAELVVVSGGNTFQLLAEVRRRGLLEKIRNQVRAGVPYVGWSAGANLACPTIKTTNDMPIVDPGGLDALALVPFQINPHYTNAHPPGHQGETRSQSPSGSPKGTGCASRATRSSCAARIRPPFFRRAAAPSLSRARRCGYHSAPLKRAFREQP